MFHAILWQLPLFKYDEYRDTAISFPGSISDPGNEVGDTAPLRSSRAPGGLGAQPSKNPDRNIVNVLFCISGCKRFPWSPGN